MVRLGVKYRQMTHEAPGEIPIPESVLHMPELVMGIPMPESESQIVNLRPLAENMPPSAQGWVNDRADI